MNNENGSKVERKRFARGIIKGRNFRRGSVATAITVVFLAIIVVVNFVVSTLSSKYLLTWDLTKNKAFTITSTSVEFLNKLDQYVQITILSDEKTFTDSGEYYLQANSVLKQYAKYSDKVQLNYVDVIKNPQYMSKYSEDSVDADSIIVESGAKKRILSVRDLFDVEYGRYGGEVITASKAEQELTSALVYVASTNQVKIAIVRGYDEQDFSSFSGYLNKNNYAVEEVSILSQDIPDDSAAVVIHAPQRDYDETGIKKVEEFLSRGQKTLIYLPDTNKELQKNLNALTEKWGVKLNDGLIYETDRSKIVSSTNAFLTIADYAEDTYSKNIINKDIPVCIPYSRPIELKDKETATVLLEFSASAGIKPSDMPENFDPSQTKGPIPALVYAKGREDSGFKSSRVLLCGSYILVSPGPMGSTSLNNSKYVIDVMNTITGKGDDSVIIESKTIGGQELNINAQQIDFLGFVLTLLLPVIILLVGIFVWRFRKNK